MNRIRRTLTAISFALLLATALLWVRGLYAKDTLSWGSRAGYLFVVSYPHHVVIIEDPRSVLPWHSVNLGLPPISPRWDYLELRARYETGAWTVWLPHWLLLLLFSAMPMQALLMRQRNKRRLHRGLCASCGYDLRASSDRCPECGADVEKASTGAASTTPA